MKNLDLLIPQAPKPKTDWWTWATVTQASPLQVRLDGETSPLPITPDSLVQNLIVGDRVWVQVSNRRMIIQGKGQATDPAPKFLWRATSTVTPTLTSGVHVTLTGWASDGADTYFSDFSNGIGTLAYAGTYLIGSRLSWANESDTGSRLMNRIYTSKGYKQNDRVPASSSRNLAHECSGTFSLEVGDTVSVDAAASFNSSAPTLSSVAIATDDPGHELTIYRLGD